MKITVYTIKDCAFSKQEKEYFNTNKLTFEEKDLETNKDFLTEMLAISNNFAGTPVTRVEKDDGTISVLKGFTKAEFDTVFGFASPALSSEGLPKEEASPEAGPTDSAISSPSNQVTNNQASPPTETVSPAPVPNDVPAQPKTDLTDSTDSTGSTVSPDPLKSVMDDLQAKAEPVTPVEKPPVSPPTPPPVLADEPTPTTPPVDAPAIPDFPSK